MMDTPTGYEPLFELKPVAPDIWIADGPCIKFYGIPFPTRMTVVKLSNGDFWAHTPIEMRNHLAQQICAHGPVRYLKNGTAELKRAFGKYI